MKLNNTFILFDAGGVSKSGGWKKAHEAIENAVSGMSWPADSKKGLVIPRIVSIKKGATYTDKNGKTLVWNSPKDHTLRNGVVPLKLLFRRLLMLTGWGSEETVRLSKTCQILTKSESSQRSEIALERSIN